MFDFLQQLSAASVSAIAACAIAAFTLWKLLSDRKKDKAELVRKDAEHADGIKLSLYVNITQRIFEIDRIFIEHPLLRPFFYDGVIVTPIHDMPRITALAEYILDFYSTLQEHEKRIGDASPSWVEWTGYIKDGFQRSPFLCCYFAEHSYWYEPGLSGIFNPIAKQNDTKIKEQRAALSENNNGTAA